MLFNDYSKTFFIAQIKSSIIDQIKNLFCDGLSAFEKEKTTKNCYLLLALCRSLLLLLRCFFLLLSCWSWFKQLNPFGQELNLIKISISCLGRSLRSQSFLETLNKHFVRIIVSFNIWLRQDHGLISSRCSRLIWLILGLGLLRVLVPLSCCLPSLESSSEAISLLVSLKYAVLGYFYLLRKLNNTFSFWSSLLALPAERLYPTLVTCLLVFDGMVLFRRKEYWYW